MKRILIVGASSFVGSNLAVRLRRHYQIYGTFGKNKPHLNGIPLLHFPIDSKSPFHELVTFLKPDAVVYCAAITNEMCDKQPEYARFINAEAPIHLARALETYGGRFIYFSSSKVFTGKKGAFSESDPTGPDSNYGMSKVQAEQELAHIPRVMIYRLGTVFGLGSLRQNSAILGRILRNLQSPAQTRFVCDEMRSFIGVEQVARAVGVGIDTNQELLGTYHVAGPESHAYYDFAREVASTFDLPMEKVGSIKASEFRKEPPTPNLTLKAELFAQTFNLKFANIQTSLRTMREELRLGTW